MVQTTFRPGALEKARCKRTARADRYLRTVIRAIAPRDKQAPTPASASLLV